MTEFVSHHLQYYHPKTEEWIVFGPPITGELWRKTARDFLNGWKSIADNKDKKTRYIRKTTTIEVVR